MFVGESASVLNNYQRPPSQKIEPEVVDIDANLLKPETEPIDTDSARIDMPIEIGPLYTIEISQRSPDRPSVIRQAEMPQITYPAAAQKSAPVQNAAQGGPVESREPCQTCENRRYVDKSDDSGVSYQVPTKISSNVAASKVMAHEREHVTHERADAERDDSKVVYQSVSLKYDCCPDCGSMFVAGGLTRTVKSKEEALDSYGNFKQNSAESDEKVSLSV